MHILMVSHNRELSLLRQAVLKAQGVSCVFCETQSEALDAIERELFDAMAVCHTVPEETIEEIHQAFSKRNPDAGVVLILKDWTQEKKDDPDAVILGIEGPNALRRALELVAADPS
jgi:DNA-binding response OmpR family regulator